MIRNININVDIGYLLCRMYALCLSSMGDFLSVTSILLQSRKRKRQRNNNIVYLLFIIEAGTTDPEFRSTMEPDDH